MKKPKKVAKTPKAKSVKTTAKKTTAKKAVSKKPKESTHVIAILDRSMSMKPIAKDAIGGYNEFLGSQAKLKDKATLSGVLFDDRYETLYEGKSLNIKDVPELTDKEFVPRGMTALYDAIGKSVTDFKEKMKTMKKSELPAKVLVFIVTDGHENMSKEFTKKDVADLIAYQKTQGWQFMFLCSTEDAVTVGESLNISKGNTFKYKHTGKGKFEMYAKIGAATASFRGMSADVALRNSDSLLDEN